MTMEQHSTRGGDLCPVCESRVRVGARLPDYQLFHCPACGCWSSDAQHRQASLSFENPDYFANADLDRPKWEALLERLEAGGRRVESLLDVGCGTGAFLAWVSRTRPGMRCEGIEIDPARAAEARARNPNARIHGGDADTALASTGRPFDLITLWDVFEHVASPTALLTALAENLTPGGVVHIVTIHENSLVPALGRLSYRLSGGRLQYPLRRSHEPHHLVFFTRRGLDTAARRAGLRVRDVWFDRLLRGRMDGPAVVTAATSALLYLENLAGNGLFVNLVLERAGG